MEKSPARSKKRTAIYGGSFNPIHTGHTQLAQHIVAAGYVDELWLLVSPLNPLKVDSAATLLPDEVRLHLARLATTGIKELRVSDFEMRLPKPSFMVNTLAALRKHYPRRQFVLVIGADNWACFDQWYHSEEILQRHEILVYPREGYPIDPTTLPPNVRLIQAPLFNTSSSEIRQSIAQGNYQGNWLAPKVWEEIKQHRYYR